MKKLKRIFVFLTACMAAISLFVGCAQGEQEKSGLDLSLFNTKGIYADYDNLSDDEKEEFLSDASRDGYVIGMDENGRITLSKDDNTYYLGRGNGNTSEKA